jgi:hypothetical protein
MLNYGATKAVPTQRDQSLLSSKRKLHPNMYVNLGTIKNLAMIHDVVARTSRNLPLNSA